MVSVEGVLPLRGAALNQVPPAGVKTEVSTVNGSGALLGPPTDVNDTVCGAGLVTPSVSLKLMLAGTALRVGGSGGTTNVTGDPEPGMMVDVTPFAVTVAVKSGRPRTTGTYTSKAPVSSVVILYFLSPISMLTGTPVAEVAVAPVYLIKPAIWYQSGPGVGSSVRLNRKTPVSWSYSISTKGSISRGSAGYPNHCGLAI